MSLNMIDYMKEQIKRLIEVRFIRLIRYVEWLFNILWILKKKGKLKVYIDFRNINLAILKNKHLMLMVDMLINAESGTKILNFIDNHSSYNQILQV
jgi:hypothetical protein